MPAARAATPTTSAATSPAALAAPAVVGPSPETIEALVQPRRRDGWVERLALLSPIVILALWEVLSQSNILDKRFIPPPTQVVDEFWVNVENGKLLGHTRDSLSRILVGFAIGSSFGLVLGLVLGLFRIPRLLFSPIFAALYPVPKIAIFPVLLIIFGLGDASKWAAVAIGAFFLVFYNTLGGVLQIPTIYLDVARNAGASRFQVFRTVALPAALPDVFTGLRLATGTSFVVLVAAEFVGAKSGLGMFIWSSWMTLQVDRMFMGIVVIALLGYLAITFVGWLERRFVPWVPRH
jgi:NitT/TauT family transport system permease protein